MVSEPTKKSMAWMETYALSMELEHLGALGIMGENGPVCPHPQPPYKNAITSWGRTRNKCELTHQFTFWNGDISFRAMRK